MPPRPTARKRRTPASPTPIPIDRANAFGRLTEQSLRRFEEKQLGARLPADYRRWLLRHNGGLPRPPSLSGEAGDVMDYPVRLFPLHDRPYSDDTPEGSLGFPLHAALKNLRREPPDDQALLPMGADWWGNYYCLALRGGRRGRVFLLDHETGSLADEAESFSDFLSNLE